MPLIEGLGDEVTFVLGGFLLCIVIMLAWFSTHTADIPLLREVGVIVVELSQRRNRTRNPPSDHPASGRDEAAASGESSDRPTTSVVSNEGNLSSETSDSNVRSGEEANAENCSREEGEISVAQTFCSTSRDDVNIQSSTAGEIASSASRNLLPEAAEMVIREANEASNSEMPANEDTDTVVPKSSVVVEETCGTAHSVDTSHLPEDEIRRRRIQYFQTGGSAEGDKLSDGAASGEHVLNHKSEQKEPSSRLEASVNEGAEDSSRNDGADNSNANLTSVPDSGDSESSQASSQKPTQSRTNEHHDQDVQPESAGSSRIRVKLKYMNETQRLVYASPSDTIGDFRRTHFQPELQDNKWVRFIYNGQDLRDDARTLNACNIGDNCTMHCLITSHTRPAPTRDATLDEEDDSFMGAMMYPLFTIILLIVWYFRFTYRQYFSAMSTVCLIGISFLLALSYVSSLRNSDHASHQARAAAAEGGGQQHQEHQHVD